MQQNLIMKASQTIDIINKV